MSSKRDFGLFARKARTDKGLGLREAARAMNISAAYLSRVENGVDKPSGQLIHKLSAEYQIPIEEFTERAPAGKVSDAHVRAMRSMPDLRALYRLGAGVGASRIEDFIREILAENGTPEDEIERKLAELKSEFPRIRNSGREGLFATDVRPRVLSKKRIALMARTILYANDLTEATYNPPTPIESLIENQPELLYRIDDLECDEDGNPIVLGLTGWGPAGTAEIVISGALADSRRDSDEARFNYTLAHEFFHAIEHLPRVPRESVTPMARKSFFFETGPGIRKSAAERAVCRWTKCAEPRHLATNEDWREWQSNYFASVLLMPDWAVVKEFESRTGTDGITVDPQENIRQFALDISSGHAFEGRLYGESLAELFAVSRQAMAIRLLELKLVQEGMG